MVSEEQQNVCKKGTELKTFAPTLKEFKNRVRERTK